jgi:hypothetical protein
MGIIQWWNDKWNKPTEAAQEAPKVEPALPIGWEKVEVKVFDNDADRVEHYKASGGEIVDMSNKPRKEGDGFPPDHELLTPFNRAHEGTKAGLAGMVGRKR